MEQVIPAEFENRWPVWIECAKRLLCDGDPYIPQSIENLGIAERMLLQMETDLKSESRKQVRDALLSECSAHSILWVFGLYEVLRKVREMKIAQHGQLERLFQKLEVIRMPLAKHEVKSAPQYRKKLYYPTSVWSLENGWVGWHVFNPVSETNEVFYRTELANEFLTITAITQAES